MTTEEATIRIQIDAAKNNLTLALTRIGDSNLRDRTILEQVIWSLERITTQMGRK